MKTGLFPFSADPPTLGHLNIIKRASSLFESLHVVIFYNEEKTPFIPVEDRLSLIKDNLKDLSNVTYAFSSGLLADYCLEHGVEVVVRALRNCSDFDYEEMLERGNKSLLPKLETLYLRSEEGLRKVSSTAVKNLHSQGAFLHHYVPSNVKQYMEALQGVYMIGYTGSIAVGKTYLGEKIAKKFCDMGREAHYVDMDCVVHRIYKFDKYTSLGQRFENYFGKEMINDDGSLDRKKLSQKLYHDSSQEDWDFVAETLRPALISELQEYVKEHKGIILLDGAVLVENDMLGIVNYNLILVDCPFEKQLKQLMERDGIDEETARKKILKVNTTQTKRELYQQKKEQHGCLFEIDDESQLEDFCHKVLNHFQI